MAKRLIRYQAAIVRSDGLLLVRWEPDGYPPVWLVPGGGRENETEEACVVREVREETGIDCEVVRPIAVLDGQRRGFTRIPLVSLVFHCRAVGGELAAHPLECDDVGFFAEDALPHPTVGAELWADHAFRAIRGEVVPVMFDPPRTPPWRDEHSIQEDE